MQNELTAAVCYCPMCGRLLKGEGNGTLDWLKAETEGTQ